MPFVKVQKNRAYYKRFQVKWRRRREGKTDYRARLRMVVQDKNKYATPRYRLVARLTNHYVIAQVVRSEIDHDVVVAAAYSSELGRYGLKVGLKNYAAAYCTGLLVARRLLQKYGLADQYKGNEEVTAKVVKTEHTNDAGRKREYWVKEVAADKKPFRAVLDVGTRATTTGHRVFAVLKGASDGGLDIPHNEKRFPGYNRDAKEYKPEVHRQRIMGITMGAYMCELQEENPEGYTKHFSQYVKAGIKVHAEDDLAKLYAAVHAAIRRDPKAAPKKAYTPDAKFTKPGKLTHAQRAERVIAKKAARLAQLKAAATGGAAAADDEDDE